MDIKLPQLSETASSGTVVTIFVNVGDHVDKDQALLELENEKAVASIPSTSAGVVSQIHVAEGDEVTVGQLLVSLSEAGATSEEPVTEDKPIDEKEDIETEPAVTTSQEEENLGADDDYRYESASGVSPPASPTIRRLARDLGIDLKRVRGTDRGGRILKKDLKTYILSLQRSTAGKVAPSPEPATPVPKSIDFSRWGPITKTKMSSIRRTISRRMAESWNTIPHVTQFDEADITDLLAVRKKYVDAYKEKGTRLTLTVFVMKACAAALKKHPIFNSSLDESTNEIVEKNYYHLGIAVDTDAGLIVPVIRDVDKKDMLDLSKDLEAAAEKARERKLTPEDMTGGSFTISNQGGIGGGHFTPIINKPEAAILGIGRGVVRAVLREDQPENRTCLPLGLSYDHRIIDGASAARFITDLVGALEQFDEKSVKI